MWINTQTDIIRKVLSPAVQLWLRSLLEEVQELNLNIQGHDRQIVRGYIPAVSLESSGAVYQGLHLGKIQVKGENIRINIGQILRGKPFRLLEPIRVMGELQLEETEINASLSSEILGNAFTDLLVNLLEINKIPNPRNILQDYQVTWEQVRLQDGEFSIKGSFTNKHGVCHPITIVAGLELVNPQTLRIAPKQIEIMPQMAHCQPEAFEVDLGSDVELTNLNLQSGQLACLGRVVVQN